MNKLLFFDIDGTLAIKTEVPQSAQEAIKKVREKGYKVLICTGRSYYYAQKHFKEFADGFICSNGRFAILDNQVIYNQPLTSDYLQQLESQLQSLNVDYALFDQQKAYFIGSQKHFKEMEKIWSPEYLHLSSPDSQAKIYNFDIVFETKEQFEKIKEVFKDTVLFNPHFPHMSADATVIGCDKGKAIQDISQQLGVLKEDTYAFGDGHNDLLMVGAVGHMIAMGNGIDELKEKADYVTTDILDDGIKNALEHYHLI